MANPTVQKLSEIQVQLLTLSVESLTEMPPPITIDTPATEYQRLLAGMVLLTHCLLDQARQAEKEGVDHGC